MGQVCVVLYRKRKTETENKRAHQRTGNAHESQTGGGQKEIEKNRTQCKLVSGE